MIANIYTIVSPLTNDYYLSGGHTSGRDLIEALKLAGYYVNVITPKDVFIHPDNADLNIYFDVFNDPRGSKWFGQGEQKTFLESKKPCMLMECAYTGVTAADYGGWDINPSERYQPNPLSDFAKELINKSALNVFLSPLHQNEWANFIGYEIPRSFNYFQRVNGKIFYNKGLERPINALYVGAITRAKGVPEVQAIFGDNIKFIGRGDLSLIDQTNYLGVGTPEQISDAMNAAVYFVHMPNWKEPSARTVVEASMCGCMLITNENVGACSFGITNIGNPQVGVDHFNQLTSLIKDIKNEK